MMKYIKYYLNKFKNFIIPEKRNYVHHRDRRDTPEYKKRRKIVETIWSVIAILIILLIQIPEYYPLIIFFLIFTPIVSFAILDDYTDDDKDNNE